MSPLQTDNLSTANELRQRLTEHLTRLTQGSGAEELNVDGQSYGVVMSTETFNRLIEQAEYGRGVRAIRRSLDEFGRGQDVSADEVFAELRSISGQADA